jgi:hypothetical protein
MKEASIDAKQAGERGISAKSIKKVTEVQRAPLNGIVVLADFRPDNALEIQGLNIDLDKQ